MPRRDGKLLAYLELLRLPNVFTAIADVLMGCFFVSASPLRTELPRLRISVAFLLVGASSCLYLAGMVWNDYFDRDTDARERPFRPIPSRRVPESAAQWMGSELIIVGIALAAAASYFIDIRAGLVALCLAIAVLLYDGLLKSTFLGPLNMGLCRSLNVLLGMSAVSAPWEQAHYLVAGGLGLYILGVTWFARTEATRSNRFALVISTVVIWGGICVLAYFPNLDKRPTLVSGNMQMWYLFWILLGLQIGWRCLRAVLEPVPANVQRAVKHCLFSLIVLDAAVAFATHSLQAAVLILILLFPTMFLGRWIYST